ncbi:hypothetical protein WH47_09784 [Habropoda laboriosa]|uniref:Uncharacterized protein n=1 Tax=Habropoda laboriosa TaxID=597456 RepID=A0A0L7QIZ7_9HYME|nr:hypothetical protein WH47_09784 [Habropoda laboriosa]
MRIPEVNFPTTRTDEKNVIIDAVPEADSVIQYLWTGYYKNPREKRLEKVTALSVQLAAVIGNLKDWLWTGHRKMSIRTWYELILETPVNDNKDLKERPNELSDIEIPKLEDLLADWVRHPDGIDDLFFAAFILFGKVENGLENLSIDRIETLLNGNHITHSIEELFNLYHMVDSLEESQIDQNVLKMVSVTLENISLSLPEEIQISNEVGFTDTIYGAMIKKMLINYIIGKIKENDQLIYHWNRTLVSWMQDKSGRTKKIYERIDKLKAKPFEGSKHHIKGKFTSALIVDGSMPDPKKLITVLNYEKEIASQFINDSESQALYRFTDGLVDAITYDIKKKDVGKPSRAWGTLACLINWFTPYGYLLPIYRAVVGEVKAKKAVEDFKKGTMPDDIPDLFKLYPAIARDHDKAPDSGYERMRSKPIFNNATLTVTRTVLNQRIDISAKAGSAKSHSAYTGEYGVALKVNRSVKVEEVPALDKSESDTILKLCDDLIGIAESYLKDGKSRSENLLKSYQTVEKKLNAVMRKGSIFYSNSAGFKALTTGLLNGTETASVEEIEAKASAPVEADVSGKGEGEKFEKPIEAEGADKGMDQATETPVNLNKDTSDICEAAQTASNKVEAKMRAEQKECDALITSAENLIELGEGLESIQAAGNVDVGSIAILNAAVESILQTIPEDARDIDMPSVETFGDGNESAVVTLSLEGIVQGLQKIIAKVVHNINGRLVSFRQSVIERQKVTASLKSKIASLEGSINEAHREEGEKTVSGKWLKHLCVDGKTPEPGTLIGTLKYQTDLTKELFSQATIDAISDMTVKFADGITSDLKKRDVTNPSKWWYVLLIAGVQMGFFPGLAATLWSLNSGLKTVVSNMRDIYSREIPDIFKTLPMVAKNNISGEENVIKKGTNPLLGNAQIVAGRLKDDVRISLTESTGVLSQSKVTGVGFSLAMVETGKASPATEIRGLTGGEQKQVLGLCKVLVEAMEEFSKNSQSHVKRYTESSIKATNEIVDAVGGIRQLLPGNNLGANGMVFSIQKIQQNVYAELIGTQTNYLRHLQTTVNSLLSYVSASSSEAKKTKEDE